MGYGKNWPLELGLVNAKLWTREPSLPSEAGLPRKPGPNVNAIIASHCAAKRAGELLVKLNVQLKESLAVQNPDPSMCMQVLDKIDCESLVPVLKDNADFVSTIKRGHVYNENSWDGVQNHSNRKPDDCGWSDHDLRGDINSNRKPGDCSGSEYEDLEADDDGDWKPDDCSDPESEHGQSENERMNLFKSIKRKRIPSDIERGSQRDTQYPAITIPMHTSKADGKRSYDKMNSCYFCEDMKVGKIPRHLAVKHKDEPEVAKLLALPAQERQLGFEKLRLLGDFQHNIAILDKQEGELFVKRRPNKRKVAEDYLPCVHCLGFIDVHEMWAHIKACKHKKSQNDNAGKSIIAECRMLLDGGNSDLSPRVARVKDVIVKNMREKENDKVKQTVQRDSLILQFGGTLLERKGELQKNDIGKRMRQLARLVLKVDEIDQPVTLNQCIDGKMFDVVVEATHQLCVAAEETTMSGMPMTKSPSLGLHIGYSLIKCCNLKRGIAIRLGDQRMRREADDFKDLYESEWADLISGPAVQSLKERVYRKRETLPTTADLCKLKEFTEEAISKGKDQLLAHPCKKTWRSLATALFVAVTLFNKRRGGENARLLLRSFRERHTMDRVINEDLMDGLSPLEKKLARRFDCIDLPGKRNRKVPLLIKGHWASAMELLDCKREQCDVSPRNIFFFATPARLTHINAWQTLHDFSLKAGCQSPSDISTTRLRKYTSTLLQILDLSDGELEWLSNHLGHELNIHKDVYRLHSPVIEVGKVAKLLLAVELGVVGKLQGKNVNEIDEDDIILPDERDENEDEEDEAEEPCSKRARLLETSDEDRKGDSQEETHCQRQRGMDKSVVIKKKRWTEVENRIFYQTFQKYVMSKKMPPRRLLERVANELPCRSVAQIRTRVNNFIKDKQKSI
ncbi:uncharacterized protein [Diadema antillarum]|uniref:uncharacterized protein n=1 Tax=Diadema antillarum TaxID=105358 RepID=UPI003A837AE2